MDFDDLLGGAAGAAAQHRQAARQERPGSTSRSTTASTTRAWADYEAVYRASWKPEEGSFPFLRALAEQEGAAGTLRLGVARKDGRPVAVQLWLVENGEATIHKLAYAEDAKAMSPGTLLGMAMFRRALDEDRVARDRLRHRRRRLQEGLDGGAAAALAARTPSIPRTLRGLIGAARAGPRRLSAASRSR